MPLPRFLAEHIPAMSIADSINRHALSCVLFLFFVSAIGANSHR
jgi:hypothetical protein